MDPHAPAPLASAFKLYVLHAVADAVRAGELTWDDTVTVTDATRSLPSGELQDEPDGTRVTIREAAEKMIAISDNTAADMLIQHVSRERVEAAVAEAGHHDPGLMRPFLTTRELFQLGWGADRAPARAWREGDESERRSLLERIGELPLDVEAADVAGPAVWPDGIDWFASAADTAAVHHALHEMDDPTVRAILAENPGIRTDGAWQHVAFKGGSSLGVLTGSWLGEATDGTLLTVVVLMSSEDPADLASAQRDLVGLAEDAFRLASVRATAP
ncbi:serine hydrolase [Microbacterium album]|uniref:Beta-lactamase class A catalytic domain-containing protein n=1 Tax=Microbacterium album TaxID=2053191 RepID=A0A917IFT8_9MICO|nr:serine hydrolase [Microbacterium album]GGH45276.1 hypothetical protein GCM10010921_20550 [Microbacterium album]